MHLKEQIHIQTVKHKYKLHQQKQIIFRNCFCQLIFTQNLSALLTS